MGIRGPERQEETDLPPLLPNLPGNTAGSLPSRGLLVGGGLAGILGAGVRDVESWTFEYYAHVPADKALDMPAAGWAFSKGLGGNFLDNLKAAASIAGTLVCWHY